MPLDAPRSVAAALSRKASHRFLMSRVASIAIWKTEMCAKWNIFIKIRMTRPQNMQPTMLKKRRQKTV